MKKIFFLTILLGGILGYGQVGINTTSPNAILDIQSSNQANPENTDGILIPKIDAFPATDPTVNQQGMLVYLTTQQGSNMPGFYWWDFNGGQQWRSISGNANSGEFESIGGLVQNTTNTAGDHFVFGSTSLDDITGTDDNRRLFFNKSKGAFRTGSANSTQWDDANVGNNSVAFGVNNTASGSQSMAFGWGNIASGAEATAFGSVNQATGTHATAFGNFNEASGAQATVLGLENTVSGDQSTVWGQGNTASGTRSTAWGQTNEVSEFATTAWGESNTASGLWSTAWGYQNNVGGENATVWGQGNTVSGARSTAWGQSNTASEFAATIWGESNTASGLWSTAWGYQNNAGGTNTTVWGQGNTATSLRETVFGSFSTDATGNAGAWITTDRLFTIGNGNDEFNKSNAFLLLKNGLASLPSVTNSLIDAADGKAVVTKEWVQANSGGGSGEFVSIGGLVQNTTNIATDNFVFGSTSLDDITGTDDDSRMFFNKSKRAFRAGRATGNHWNNTNVGNYSVAFGDNNRVSGNGSSAFGVSNIVSGGVSTASGELNNASGIASTAIGSGNISSGPYSVSLGLGNETSGYYSIALGKANVANTVCGIAMGDNNYATGDYSVAMGYQSRASSFSETVLGRNATIVNGNDDQWVATDRLFTIGNGINSSNRSNAFSILKNGNAAIGNVSTIPDESRLVLGAFNENEGGQLQFNSPEGSTHTTAFFIDVFQDKLRFMTGTDSGSSNGRMQLSAVGNLGIGMDAGANRLMVNGEASKSYAGNWLANSD